MTTQRLDGMSPSEILLFFIGCTRPYLRALESAQLLEMLGVFRAYIISGYKEEGLEERLEGSPILSKTWVRCLRAISKYTGTDKKEAAL